MDEKFLRTEMLLGPQAMEQLAASHVAVFGLGGVGSWCAEALARSGVGALTLIDHDEVGLTNLNRQVEATLSTLGKPKALAMAERIADINPDCKLTVRAEKYEAARREAFFSTRYDYIVDCIDLVSCKLDLIETALTRGIPILSALGTGNKLDPSQFRIGDISKTEGCPLARVVRKELRARGIHRHRVLWSPEEPKSAIQHEAPPPGRRSVPGSVAWVPPVAGLMMAGDVICSLINTQR
ncbi:tRNA threonylcarbamoyladenosine dehydratase [Pseudoflavonifractor phocaeensis]|uniref:tRNA threonylcarbamoyladenosine dehydratase n=1 Tax=Pseudoflavonifractor phocaeensis TaxID=1870988 RepID=UPI001959CA41|nr:tRNA threonylcarbamoyladenosine dehydratase [Pseudoflavonifractor phocaeensis]MBM6925797.1 tRNA threonylcarbamoyladenosine dehydratase [Pseudoflavonifractor phocaeensis]